jgi:hypothetical protein
MWFGNIADVPQPSSGWALCDGTKT